MYDSHECDISVYSQFNAYLHIFQFLVFDNGRNSLSKFNDYHQ